jgi:3-oxoacyl-[acyl-carrier-protein] synthase-1/3-oxoacyl-[acyl-carrier-protein] synthase II
MGADAVMVSGMGCLCAAGRDVGACVSALYDGRRATRDAGLAAEARIRVDLPRPLPVFEIEDSWIAPDPSDEAWADGPAARDLLAGASRTSLMAWRATLEALRDAGIGPSRARALRVGVAMGTTVGCTLNDEAFYRAWRRGERPDTGPAFRFLRNNPAEFLSRALGLRGPAATVANACSSGADAIGVAKAWLEDGHCDLALAGGADELSRVTCLGFASLLIASETPCRPFDKNRTGLNLGEGAGMLVLERRGDLERRGAGARARLAAYASFADAWHPTAPHPEGRGLRRAIQRVLDVEGLRPEQAGFCNAHGTSTPDNDRVEGSVLAALFGGRLPVVSTKSRTGHTLGAAGGIEAVFTVRALMDGRLPATTGFTEADHACGIEPTRTNIEIDADYGISNSLAFGGNNSVLLFGRAT